MYLILSLPIYAVLTMNLFPSSWIKSRRKDALKYLGKVILLAGDSHGRDNVHTASSDHQNYFQQIHVMALLGFQTPYRRVQFLS